jgi:hypothetical protein
MTSRSSFQWVSTRSASRLSARTTPRCAMNGPVRRLPSNISCAAGWIGRSVPKCEYQAHPSPHVSRKRLPPEWLDTTMTGDGGRLSHPSTSTRK